MNVYTGKVKSTATPYANIRLTPNGADIGDVLPNTPISGEGDLLTAGSNIWMNVKTVALNGAPISGWMATSVLDYTTEVVPDVQFPTSIWLSMTPDGERREYRLVA